MTPSLTWAQALPILLKASRSIWPTRRAAAKRELERMAKLADERVEWLKQEALDRPSWVTSQQQAKKFSSLDIKRVRE